MKNILIVLLLAMAVALGALAYHQSHQAAQNRAELLSVHAELAAVQSKLKATAEATDRLAGTERSAKALQELPSGRTALECVLGHGMAGTLGAEAGRDAKGAHLRNVLPLARQG